MAFAFATWWLALVWGELLYAGEDERCFLPDFATPAYVAALLAHLGLTGLLFSAVRLVRRVDRPALYTITSGGVLIGLVPLVPFVRQVLPLPHAAIIGAIRQYPVVLGGAAVIAALVAFYLFVTRLEQVARVVAFAMLVTVPFGVMTMGQTVCRAFMAPSVETLRAGFVGTRSAPRTPARHPVVIVVFDEFDLRLAFDEPPKGLQMPNLSALKETGVWASAAYPTTDWTHMAVPELLTGEPIVKWKCQGRDRYRVQVAGEQGHVPLASLPTIFGDARERGHDVRLAGITLPYCRVFEGQFDGCHVANFGRIHLGGDLGVLETLAMQLDSLTALYRVSRGRDTYVSVHEQARRWLARGDIDLVFLHYSVPHHPWIWNEDDEALTRWDLWLTKLGGQGYIRNLALTDRTFGELRDTMRRAGTWDRAAVIVTGDHSWRESRLYDGKRDMRVPLLIKLPAGGRGGVLAPKMNTYWLRAAIAGLMAGDIKDFEDVRKLVDDWRADHPFVAATQATF